MLDKFDTNKYMSTIHILQFLIKKFNEIFQTANPTQHNLHPIYSDENNNIPKMINLP